jgi:hypothetical protein
MDDRQQFTLDDDRELYCTKCGQWGEECDCPDEDEERAYDELPEDF